MYASEKISGMRAARPESRLMQTYCVRARASVVPSEVRSTWKQRSTRSRWSVPTIQVAA
jgi:hypothetical protein